MYSNKILLLYDQNQNQYVKLSIEILQKHYDKFSKKNFEGIIKEINISEKDLKKVYLIVEKLNPFPASNFNKNFKSPYIIPDFSVSLQGDKNWVTVTKRSGRELRVNSHYQNKKNE